MTTLLTSPRLIDAILVLTALEAVVLWFWPRRRSALRSLLPGVCLLLALRAALADAPWPWVPAALAAALAGHLFDLAGRG